MDSPVEQIKSRLDIVEVVGGYVKLHNAGINLKARCPFHQEKTPSFFVSPARQTWHCFGACNKGGDIFSFIQEIEGVDFKEALRILAQRAGVELRYEPKEQRDERQRLFDANSLAAEFFVAQLERSAAGQRAREYLASRGLRDETINAFHLGWAPSQDNALSSFLRSRGFSETEIEQAGLALAGKDRGMRDRFRGRILFPIFDGSNRVVGFTGRIFGREEGEYDPKYLNTPDTPIFEKGRLLYGLHIARKAIRREGKALFVEGQMDALMAHQAGSAYAVATSGTALTPRHLTLISRLADTIIFAYDADTAGVEAARRGIDLALEVGLFVRLAIVPSGKDPADFIRDDAAAWQELVSERTKPVLAFLIERAITTYDVTTPEGKRRAAGDLIPVLGRVGNAVEQGHWVAEAASALRVRDETLWQELVKQGRSADRQTDRPADSRVDGSEKASSEESANPSVNQSPRSRREILEEHLLALLLLRGKPTEGAVPDGLLVSPFARELAPLAVAAAARSDDFHERLRVFPVAAAAAHRPDAERIVFSAEAMFGQTRDPDGEIAACLREIRALDIRERLDAISLELEAAERSGDAPRVRELTDQFRSRSADLSALFSQEAAPAAL